MSETNKDQETSSEQGNAKRRRLVRGAMALAPLVLTLRSGAQTAAVSCTGVKAIVNIDSNGKVEIPNAQQGETYVCYTGVQQCTSMDHPKIATRGPGTRYGVVEIQPNGVDLKCLKDGTTNTHLTSTSNVAILSSQSVTSFVTR